MQFDRSVYRDYQNPTFAPNSVRHLNRRPSVAQFWDRHYAQRQQRLPAPAVRAQFFNWMQRAEPAAFSLLTGRPTLDGLSDAAVAPADAASKESTASWWQTLPTLLIGAYKDVKTYETNLRRARQNLAPLDPSIGQTQVGVNVGVQLDPQQRNLLIAGGLGLAALLAFSAMK